MYTEWRRLQPAGMRRDQESRLPLHERTKLLKACVGTVVPGFLQTPGYATALLSAIRDFHGTPDDVADAVAARMQRRRLVQSGSLELRSRPAADCRAGRPTQSRRKREARNMRAPT